MLLFVKKCDSACIQVVVGAHYANVAGIDFWFEYRRGRTQRLRYILDVRFYCRFEITFRRGLDGRLLRQLGIWTKYRRR